MCHQLERRRGSGSALVCLRAALRCLLLFRCWMPGRWHEFSRVEVRGWGSVCLACRPSLAPTPYRGNARGDGHSAQGPMTNMRLRLAQKVLYASSSCHSPNLPTSTHLASEGCAQRGWQRPAKGLAYFVLVVEAVLERVAWLALRLGLRRFGRVVKASAC